MERVTANSMGRRKGIMKQQQFNDRNLADGLGRDSLHDDLHSRLGRQVVGRFNKELL